MAEAKTLDDYPVLAERTVYHGLFWYYVPENTVQNGEEKVILVQHTAFQGQKIKVFLNSDLERADRVGALFPEGEGEVGPDGQPIIVGTTHPEGFEEGEGEDEEVELSELADDELVDWLMSTGEFDGNKKPTAAEVLEGAGDDKELADRLLAAETQASGGEPRKSVKEGLEKVKAEDAA